MGRPLSLISLKSRDECGINFKLFFTNCVSLVTSFVLAVTFAALAADNRSVCFSLLSLSRSIVMTVFKSLKVEITKFVIKFLWMKKVTTILVRSSRNNI